MAKIKTIDFKKIKKVHFIGIGGSGMISLVNLLMEKGGMEITGSDQKDFPLRKSLEKRGIKIFIGHRKENIQNPQLIIYSSSIPKDNIEIKEAKKRKIPIIHRFDFLVKLLDDKKVIAVSGSHGKSTTTAMIGYLLESLKFNPTIYLGAKTKQWPLGSRWGKGEYAVIETDEHDASFLKVQPYISVILNVDNDHLDPKGPFKGDFSCLKNAFFKFALKTKHKIIINTGDNFLKSFLNRRELKNKIFSFSLKPSKEGIFAKKIDIYPFNSDSKEFKIKSEIFYQKKKYQLNLKTINKINVINALAALSVLLELSIPLEKGIKILENFKGAKRRFELVYQNKVIVIDDYAHHPTELLLTLENIRTFFPQKRIFVVFEPHRYSRVFLLSKDFAKAFSLLKKNDYLFLLPIDSANEINSFNASSEIIRNEIIKKNYLALNQVFLIDYPDLENKIFNLLKKEDVLIFIGPGKIANYVAYFIKKLKKNGY